MLTLLIATSGPLDQDRLRLGHEAKQIAESLKRSHNTENWVIERCKAVTVDDLRRSLLEYKPTIVHFSGHGGQGGICFEK